MSNGGSEGSTLPSDSKVATQELKSGYVIDYISGEEVKATPEEVQAVQVFARRLVEDYGYEKSQIQTRPQFRVRKRPPALASKSNPFSAPLAYPDLLLTSSHLIRLLRKDSVHLLTARR